MPGKRTGAHPNNRLTARMVGQAKPGRYSDGGGLMLFVAPTGAKSWVLRVTVQGKRRDIGIGSASVVSLADAREEARKLRAIAKAGGDPLAERNSERTTVPTFEQAAREVHAELSPGWKNPKHRAQWLASLEAHAFPHIGHLPVDQVGLPEVRKVLAPIWTALPETARRVRQRLGQTLDWSYSKGHRGTAENPVRVVHTGLPPQPKRDNHFRALPWQDVPAFLQRVRMDQGSEMSALGMELLVLTVSRTGPIILARWPQFDLSARLWVCPPEAMKGSRAHTVPLAPQAVAILERLRDLHSGKGEFVLESRPGRAYSNGVFLSMLRRMEVPATSHGFRSSFADWCTDTDATPREVREAALAHVIPDKTKAAYARTTLLNRRRVLMEKWADFVTGAQGKVIPLPGVAS